MTAPKTRCKQCVNSDKKATQEPCNQCAEIFSSSLYKFDNHFLDLSKNLMKGDNS